MIKLIRVDNVSYSYNGTEQVLDGMNLTLSDGKLTALIGANGSGKTTLGKLMAGVLQPTSGQVLIDDKDTREMSLGEIGKRIGYLFQEPDRQIFAPTVEEELSFVLKVRGFSDNEISELVNDMLSLFHLDHLRSSFPFYLSKGEKQRLALASILINKPDFLILDEPTTALDIKRKSELLEILKKLLDNDVGMLIISHDYEFVTQYADRIIKIAGGEIISDTRTSAEQSI
ncbi:energy-coupling factor ABC transporter ATP-binding protein [Natranaerobius thermophilus]|uniref:ABC transporter related n=1 Tax=Natranaerobius thermophilus (strain ATCC BAA-1301 / DSM 18059 / JW/NM-WN-LF) TaxID=457570 RepID=B2A599_NATTJ|nr:ABC transporter ATP-binding protein [Natranaerobius thermophilus]ACB83933.1 ABC transporter related [Natranaerobius thermophilus JW/NM-WN-LF]